MDLPASSPFVQHARTTSAVERSTIMMPAATPANAYSTWVTEQGER
jgi:gamma-glutamyl:cysteine ligase YbdK (ATP-grasp superfamily)